MTDKTKSLKLISFESVLSEIVVEHGTSPYNILLLIEELYRLKLELKAKTSYSESLHEEIKNKEARIKEISFKLGYGNNGVTGGSRILKNISNLLSETCPILHDENDGWGKINTEYFFDVLEKPETIDKLCYSSNRARNILAAFCFLDAVAETVTRLKSWSHPDSPRISMEKAEIFTHGGNELISKAKEQVSVIDALFHECLKPVPPKKNNAAGSGCLSMIAFITIILRVLKRS